MPRLFDLLSDGADKQKLTGLSRQAASGRNREKPRSEPAPPLIRIPDFVALDLETTGLDEKNDRITEIGAVQFRAGEATGSFSTFVNPGKPIPAEVTALTGITDADVAGAPPFADIAQRLLDFVGELPVCGHQVDFDAGFLRQELARAGMRKPANALLDTALLSRLTLPELSGFSLGQIASHLGIRLDRAHRALDDARATGMAAAAMIPKIMEIPADVRRIMVSFAPFSIVKKLLALNLDGRPPLETGPRRGPAKIPPRLKPADERAPIDPDAVAALFGENGALAGLLPGFIPREAQRAMAREVGRTINAGGLLAAEAGTGTGKSLAYLAPAASFALASNRRVLVSTYTRNLQDQLAAKDLPLVARLFDKPLTFSVLKGRANYLCRYRYERLIAGEIGNLSPHDRSGLLPLIGWAERTATGDIEEQAQFNRKWYGKIWNLISAEAHECAGQRCPLFADCFLFMARQRAQASHIVVINHSLFFSELCSESSFLGPADTVVFDEAHHLEECGHRCLRVEVDSNRMRMYVEFLNTLSKTADGLMKRGTAVDELKALARQVKKLRKASDDFLDDLKGWADRTVPLSPAGTDYQAAYGAHVVEALAGPSTLLYELKELQDILFDLDMKLGLGSRECDVPDETAAQLSTCQQRTSQLKADLAYVAAAVTDGHVFWIEGDRRKGWVKLCGVPLDIGAVLSGIWPSIKGAAIFTSATLSVAGNMAFFRRKAGLYGPNEERSSSAVYPSPFSPDQAVRCGVARAPAPDAPEFPEFCAQAIVKLHEATGRNMLVLFTANAMLRSVESALKKSGAVAPQNLIAQSTGTSRHVLLEKFKQSKKGILLGASSFWEGIDAPGKACEIVVIPRLPFPVPTDPLTQALAKNHERESGESFMSFAVPEAAIRLRQGAGRLIRTANDRGALVILDSRMVNRGYGVHFIRSLDGPFHKCTGLEEMVRQVVLFFDNKVSLPGPFPDEEPCESDPDSW